MSLPFYKRYPRDFFEGTVGMRLELKGAYGLVIDLIMMHDRKLSDDPEYIARMIGVSPRKWNNLRRELIELGKISIDNGIIVNKIRSIVSGGGRTSLSPVLRLMVLERDGWICTYCGTGQGPFHVDHIHPVSRGGTDDPENLCCSCAPCNLSKSDKTVSEWRGQQHV